MADSSNDVPGECNAHLYIGDDHGDNHATMRCQLPKGHKGKHAEKFNRGNGQKIKVTWVEDERDETSEFYDFLFSKHAGLIGISREEYEKGTYSTGIPTNELIDEFFKERNPSSLEYKDKLIKTLSSHADYYVPIKEVPD